MPMNKPHLEFARVDMKAGWATPPGYPAGIKQKILTPTFFFRFHTIENPDASPTNAGEPSGKHPRKGALAPPATRAGAHAARITNSRRVVPMLSTSLAETRPESYIRRPSEPGDDDERER